MTNFDPKQRLEQADEVSGAFDRLAGILADGRPGMHIVFGAQDVDGKAPSAMALVMVDAEDQRTCVDYLGVDETVHLIAALLTVGCELFNPFELAVKLQQHLDHAGFTAALGVVPGGDDE